MQEIEAPWSGVNLDEDFTRAFGPGAGQLVVAGAELARRDPRRDDVEPLTWALYERALGQGTLEYLDARDRLEAYGREVVTAFAGYDAVLTPALGERPLPIGTIHGWGPDPWATYHRSGLFTPFTAVINITGLPAVALPLFHGEDGLPLGVQLIGPPAGEELLLALSAQLETAHPWADRRPSL